MPLNEAELCHLSARLGSVATKSRQYAAFPKAAVPVRLLGQGGFANVFQATAEDDEDVAMKCMKKGLPFAEFLADSDMWAAELRVLCATDHGNVMSCYAWDIQVIPASDSGNNSHGTLFSLRIAMPLMAGR